MVGVVDPEDWVGAVPVEAVHRDRADFDDKEGEDDRGEEGGGAAVHHDADQGTRLLSLLSREDSQTIVTSLLAFSDTTLTAASLTCICQELFGEIHAHFWEGVVSTD